MNNFDTQSFLNLTKEDVKNVIRMKQLTHSTRDTWINKVKNGTDNMEIINELEGKLAYDSGKFEELSKFEFDQDLTTEDWTRGLVYMV